jgi:NAD(P)-dependent dehydrogenase (short-subunit alcohol dehydrogenase family)
MTATKPTTRPSKPPVLLVTGGDTGIGLGIARKFAEAGYRICIGGLDRRRGDRVVAALAASGGEAVYFLADVRSEFQIRTLIRRTVERFGRIDVLCNNAGIQKLAPIDKALAAHWDQAMAVNARAAFLSSKYALPHLKWSMGTIVNIASTAGLVGYAGGLAYCASKAALVMMSKTTALEFAPYGIRVNCICPGATRTPLIPHGKVKNLPKQIPIGRVGEPSDVAELALFLASEKARQITGGVYVIDGGITAGRTRLT